MKKLIVIADWAKDSLYRQEVRSSIEGSLQNPQNISVNFVDSISSSIHTGFLLSQIVETEERNGRPLETVIYQHTDNRSDSNSSSKETRGADFFILRLYSGLYVCGPFTGYSYSFVKSKILKIYKYNLIDSHIHFSSRDVYSRIVSHFMESMEDKLDLEEMHENLIIPFKGHVIGHVDCHGNIKTTCSQEYFKGKYRIEDDIKIKINNVEKKARYLRNLFSSSKGELVIHPGSAGPNDDPYMDISIWQDFSKKNSQSAADVFYLPQPGDEVFLLS